MIIVDSSAVVAILFEELGADALLERLLEDQQKLMSVVSDVETGTVLARRLQSDRLQAIHDLDRLLAITGTIQAPVDEAQARRALWARIHYSQGMGTGGVVNFGDMFCYALAQTHRAPLLYVGDDCRTTDKTSAIS